MGKLATKMVKKSQKWKIQWERLAVLGDGRVTFIHITPHNAAYPQKNLWKRRNAGDGMRKNHKMREPMMGVFGGTPNTATGTVALPKTGRLSAFARLFMAGGPIAWRVLRIGAY